jgi:hypothetical protein
MIEIVQWVLLVLTLATLLIGIFQWKKKEDTKQEVNYRSFFILGITFIPTGVALSVSTGNPLFIGMSGLGAIYFVIGLKNRDKWKD